MIGTAGVIVSLIYVGFQVRQNTAAIQSSTSQGVYQLSQEQALAILQDAELAEVLLRARQMPDSMTAADSLRYELYLALRLNLREGIYTNALQGTMEAELAAGWLDDLRDFSCLPGMVSFWAENKTGYHPAFRAAVDSAFALATCPD